MNESVFPHMRNTLHVHEKWSTIYKDNNTYYIFLEEERPHHITESKRYIDRVIFLCAVGRPKYYFTSRIYFDGKIGVWPLIREERAQRNYTNRSAGTLELKPLM